MNIPTFIKIVFKKLFIFYAIADKSKEEGKIFVVKLLANRLEETVNPEIFDKGLKCLLLIHEGFFHKRIFVNLIAACKM